MAQLAVRGNGRFRCLDLEVKRQGYTYTCETLEELRGKYPEDAFFFIAGADCLFSIEKWKAPAAHPEPIPPASNGPHGWD